MVVHDVTLDDVTDVASHPEFADRYTTKTVDGVPTTGMWYLISTVLHCSVLLSASCRLSIISFYLYRIFYLRFLA